MRVVFALVFVLAAGCASTLTPMGPAPEPMPRANRVIVATPDDAGTAYSRILGILVARGYTIASSSDAARIATTDWRGTANLFGEGQLRITVHVAGVGDGAEVNLKGQLRTDPSVNPAEVARAGTSGSALRRRFDELREVASAYPGGSVLYARD